jgi:hypothetical protein
LALPVTRARASIRVVGRPMIRCRAAALGVLGTAGVRTRAAAMLSSPKLAFRPSGAITIVALVRRLFAGSFHCRAAAVINLARAVAASARAGS